MEFKILKYCLLSAIISSASVIAMESNTNISKDAIIQATNILFDTGLKYNSRTNQEELNKKFDFLKQIEIPNNTIGNARDEIDFFKNSVLPNISIEKFSYVLTALIQKNNTDKNTKNIDINTFSGITTLLYYYLHKDDKDYNKNEMYDIYKKYYSSCYILYNDLLLAFINKYFTDE